MSKTERTKYGSVQQLVANKDYNGLFYHYEYLVDAYMDKINMHDEDTKSYLQLVLLDRIHKLVDEDITEHYNSTPVSYLHRELWRALFMDTLVKIPDQHCVYINDIDETEFMINADFIESIEMKDFTKYIYTHIIDHMRNRYNASYTYGTARVNNIERDIDMFNMYYFQEKTLYEIGNKYQISSNRVRQMIARFIRCGKYYVAKTEGKYYL